MFKLIKAVVNDDKAAVATEYALVAALIAIACIFAITLFGLRVLALFQNYLDNYPG